MKRETFEIHGETKTRLYTCWRAMKNRCRPNSSKAKWYFDKGITVCDEWVAFSSFKEWAMANGYVDGLTIDRIDPDAGYSPNNCRWATHLEQGANRTRNKIVEIDGVKRTVKDWSTITGIIFSTLYKRYDRGVRGVDFIAPPLKWDSSAVPAVKTSKQKKPIS